MSNTLTLILTLLTTTLFSQTQQPVELKWKIAGDELLNYNTIMSQVDSSEFEMEIGDFFKSGLDEMDSLTGEFDSIFTLMSEEMLNQDYVTTLTNKGNDVIDIVIATKPADDKESELNRDVINFDDVSFFELYKSFSQGVMMRGSVYADGGVHSFWVVNAQKNIIALFFELPSKPVKIGDTWSLDINFIENAMNFVCDSSYRENEVKLSDIKIVNGDTIAVLQYNIVEYIDGVLNPPSLFMNNNSDQQTVMKYSYQGVSEFSITQGRWVSYYGIMSSEVSGFMSMNLKQKYALLKE